MNTNFGKDKPNTYIIESFLDPTPKTGMEKIEEMMNE